jgi:predicted HicB family RNase H-like nuclease
MNNTNKQGFTGFDDLSGIDPAVESLLNQGQRRSIESHLPKNLRSQRKKERERAQKRLAKRVNLDLPVDLKKRLKMLAKKEGVPVSQLVAFLLYVPVHQLETRMISLWGYKTSSGCRKFEWNVDLKRYADEVLRKSENGLR